ncbi:MAG: hydantoin racemase [Spirochaetaceae bacterium]|nr:MAG: hydantoin racemase [Spirochaetaceae bacterium]
MNTLTVGLLRVVSFDDPEIAAAHGRIIEQRYPALLVVTRCIPDQPKGIYDDESERIAIPKIIDQARRLVTEDGVQAVIVSCAADPAVEELRGELDVPVIGAGTAAAAVALSISTRVGTLGITEATPAPMRSMLGSFLTGEEMPEGVRNTLDLMTDTGRASAIEAARRLTASGARVVALACTGYATIGLKPELQAATGLPVVDAVEAAALCTWFALVSASSTAGAAAGVIHARS